MWAAAAASVAAASFLAPGGAISLSNENRLNIDISHQRTHIQTHTHISLSVSRHLCVWGKYIFHWLRLFDVVVFLRMKGNSDEHTRRIRIKPESFQQLLTIYKIQMGEGGLWVMSSGRDFHFGLMAPILAIDKHSAALDDWNDCCLSYPIAPTPHRMPPNVR